MSLFCAGSKTIDLEVLGDAKERDAFAWAFDKIIGEARATRIFVDKAGAPVARSEPKKRLRMILGAHHRFTEIRNTTPLDLRTMG